MASYDTRPRYIARYKCHACGAKFRKTLRDPNAPDPSCPECSAAPLPVRGMDFNRPPPAAVGMNNAVRAQDLTAEIVMSDYKMTDLRDARHEGDTMAPRLDPKRQEAADNFFAQGSKAVKTDPAVAQHVGRMQRLASSGALAHQHDAVTINRMIDSKPQFRHVGSGKL